MKTKLLIIGIVSSFIGIVIFLIGVNVFFDIQATEERLASEIKSGSSIPIVNYDNAWVYFETSVVFFAVAGFLLVWRKRK